MGDRQASRWLAANVRGLAAAARRWAGDGQAVISRSHVWLLNGDPNGNQATTGLQDPLLQSVPEPTLRRSVPVHKIPYCARRSCTATLAALTCA